jgi:hypothetical protein
MIDPEFVKEGQGIRASHLNSIVSAVRERKSAPPADTSGMPRIYRPFDPISLNWDGSDWVLKLKPSWVIEDNQPQEISFGGTTLSEYPTIPVELGKTLYLNISARELLWETPPYSEHLVIIEVVDQDEDGKRLEFINKYPSVIHLGESTSGSTITISPSGDDIKATLTGDNYQIHSRPIQIPSESEPIKVTLGADPTAAQLGPYILGLRNSTETIPFSAAPSTSPNDVGSLGLHRVASIVGGSVQNVVFYGWFEEFTEEE